jgi:hypothetical protein
VTDIAVDHLTEVTGAHGVVVAAGIVLHADHINETAGGHGILLDTPVYAVDARFNHIGEWTGGHNIVLDHLETGVQHGTGNSATGSVVAFCAWGLDPTLNGLADMAYFRCKRAGTYKVKLFNSVIYAGGGHLHLYVNGAGGVSATANNAAGTDEDCGDLALALGDLLRLTSHVACPANQVGMVTLLNADGMYP